MAQSSRSLPRPRLAGPMRFYYLPAFNITLLATSYHPSFIFAQMQSQRLRLNRC
ncbi:hypothetical protein CALCODRAFT_496697 [Calocera cornea HHB12733]|uniref:Uncharacterized protein n=1 Tax=Calocera cornea HHB12733 TaxID=1353952 RepID=A0A165FPK7_9BASI|nr:hypothetical protein CALCODRAFT_496697 [Calocera cornea HHB12733]